MSFYSRVKRFLVGKPIASKLAQHERLGLLFGLPVFAADAISSVAYSSEEVLFVLVAGGPAALGMLLPITVALAALLIIIVISYYQTIHAYPQGGGTYLVSSKNLGSSFGRVAGAALLISYVLTVAVSISSGTAAIYSAFPQTEPYAVHMACIAVGVVMLANLRGARESGMLFAVPVYLFIGTLLLMVALAVYRGSITGRVAPDPEQMQVWAKNVSIGSAVLFLQGFAASCAALTGTEAIADGVQAFRAPEAKTASRTLVTMACLMLVLSFGMNWALHYNGMVPSDPARTGYMTVLSKLGSLVFEGTPYLFYVLQASTAAILILAANTAFADFPRLSSFIARDKFLPRQLMSVGDRLVFQNGILLLSFIAVALIVIFRAETHLLVQLYAIGVFIAFTMSQAGMAAKWWRETKEAGRNPFLNWKLYVSGTGSAITACVTVVLMAMKWQYNSYLILVSIAIMMFIFMKIRKYYDYLAREFEVAPEDQIEPVQSTVLLLVPRLHRGTLRAIAYSKSMAKDCRALHVTLDNKSAGPLREFWASRGIDIPLVILDAPYRSQVEPVIEYIDQAVTEDPNAMITVIVPQGIPPKWYQALLHSNLAVALKIALSNRKNVVVTNVRYFL